MRTDDVIDLLRKACDAAGGQRAWATLHGLSAAYVGDVLHGKRDPGESILEALNLEKVVEYRKSSR